MSEYSDIIIAGAAVVLLSSWLCSLCLPLLLKTGPWNAVRTTRLLTLWALMPWITALWVCILLTHPQMAGAFFHAHCHDDVCGPHIPDIGHASVSGALLAAAITFVLALLLFSGARRLQKNHQRLQTIKMLSAKDRHNSYRLIESPLLLAWCSGLWKPRIILSRGLTQALSDEELQIVLLHEFNHALQRDNLMKLILAKASLLWFPPQRRRLLAHFAAACEQRCDEAAMAQGFTRQQVADVLQKLQSACDGSPGSQRHSTESGIRPATDGLFFSLILLVVQIAVFSYTAHPLLDMVFL
ncbi:MAG: hypothetical protein CMI02_12005 [Oceanospirillaceae bacterium]|nr:hypothetical protein [Oceanospirillaceae bacterium]MBT12743.1 hypothetical protein [Oceanospirillaceae bacterium]|tara:strand:- start:132919 stop:133812 length:894 start_codon:yes stop_codon:yes gene_type:complete